MPNPDSNNPSRSKTTLAVSAVLLVHAWTVFTIGFLLFVSKWFPYGPLKGLGEWLYRHF